MQVHVDIQESTADSATLFSSFTLAPAPASTYALSSGKAAVGELGGAHWFATAPIDTDEPRSAAEGIKQHSENSHAAAGQIAVTTQTVVYSSGYVMTSWTFDASLALPDPLPNGLLPSLPRVGLHALIPAVNDNIMTWYGRGPHECYPDRKAASLLQQHIW